MSWIRSDCSLPRHPKTILLKTLTGFEVDVIVGRLHFLWWWCLDYAIDGNLSQKDPKIIEGACQIPLKLLIKAGFVDRLPYRRIHDWWDNQGAYLRSRYHKQPELWQRIEKLYERKKDMSKDMSNTRVGISPVRRTDVTDVRTYGQKGRTDVKQASQDSAGAELAPPPKIKSYEEAGPDELCGPPPGWSRGLLKNE